MSFNVLFLITTLTIIQIFTLSTFKLMVDEHNTFRNEKEDLGYLNRYSLIIILTMLMIGVVSYYLTSKISYHRLSSLFVKVCSIGLIYEIISFLDDDIRFGLTNYGERIGMPFLGVCLILSIPTALITGIELRMLNMRRKIILGNNILVEN